MSDEAPATVAQVSPSSDHPHLTWMREEIAEQVKLQGGGGGGNMLDLERRVGNLETDVRSIRDNLSMLLTDVAVIKSNYASKTDIADLKTDISKEMLTQTRWIIATLIALISLSVAIQRFLPPQSSPMPIQAQSIPNQVEVNTNQPINKPAPTTNNIKQPTAHPSTTP